MSLLACVCHCALVSLAMSSQTKCTSGLSCRDGSAGDTQAAMLLKTKSLDRVLSHKGSPPAPTPLPWWHFWPPPTPKPYAGVMFYNEAHMTLTSHLVWWAANNKANSLEIDIFFDHTDRADGAGAWEQLAYHGGTCDCVCYLHVTSGFGHLCGPTLFDVGGGSTCEDNEVLWGLYDYIARDHSYLRMIHLDNKMGNTRVGDVMIGTKSAHNLIEQVVNEKTKWGYYDGHRSDADMTMTGENSLKMWNEGCRDKGYGHDVTLGVYADLDYPQFMVGAINYMNNIGIVYKMWIAWECLYGGTEPNVTLDQFIHGFNGLRGWVSNHDYQTARCDGITSCAHWIGSPVKLWSINLDVAARKEGKIDKAIIWTIDQTYNMKAYMLATVDVQMTNSPGEAEFIWWLMYQHRPMW